ncbi:MAG TPA: hypothetical protein VJS92_04305 [Candidatus Polarisedimenticolaceae bacterium]|nr:hypothetical protein [Candidatus Polarisedimenticolaceae bacterium]
MTRLQALAFVRRGGVVLEAARGPVPSLAQEIVGGPIRGSWWSHPRGREIFALTRAVRESPDVLVCRLVQGKTTYVHRRLWPALVRAAGCFTRADLAQLREVHTSSGRHLTGSVAFPEWVPASVTRRAAQLDEPAALSALGAGLWLKKRRASGASRSAVARRR